MLRRGARLSRRVSTGLITVSPFSPAVGPLARPAGQQAVGHPGQRRRDDHGQHDRSQADPAAGRGQCGGVVAEGLPARAVAAAPPRQQPTPAQHPAARVVREQQQPARRGGSEVAPLQPGRHHGGGHRVERQQRDASGRRRAQADDEQVDQDGDGQHADRQDERDAVRRRHRCGVAVDGVAAVRHDLGRAGRSRPGRAASGDGHSPAKIAVSTTPPASSWTGATSAWEAGRPGAHADDHHDQDQRDARALPLLAVHHGGQRPRGEQGGEWDGRLRRLR